MYELNSPNSNHKESCSHWRPYTAPIKPAADNNIPYNRISISYEKYKLGEVEV